MDYVDALSNRLGMLDIFRCQSLWKPSVDVHGSFRGHVANIGHTTHSCFELHSVGVIDWVYTIHESLFSSKPHH